MKKILIIFLCVILLSSGVIGAILICNRNKSLKDDPTYTSGYNVGYDDGYTKSNIENSEIIDNLKTSNSKLEKQVDSVMKTNEVLKNSNKNLIEKNDTLEETHTKDQQKINDLLNEKNKANLTIDKLKSGEYVLVTINYGDTTERQIYARGEKIVFNETLIPAGYKFADQFLAGDHLENRNEITATDNLIIGVEFVEIKYFTIVINDENGSLINVENIEEGTEYLFTDFGLQIPDGYSLYFENKDRGEEYLLGTTITITEDMLFVAKIIKK